MKSTRVSLMAVAIVAAAGAVAQANPADYTTIGPSGEPSLLSIFGTAYGGAASFVGADGVDMEINFGSYQITAYRIRDTNGTAPLAIATYNAGGSQTDQMFTDGVVKSSMRARYAGNNQHFGWHDNLGPAGNFTELFNANTNGVIVPFGSGTPITDTISASFQLARSSDGTNIEHYSNDADNSDGADHMVSFFLVDSRGTAGIFKGYRTYLFGFEDLPIPGADADYNDVVIEMAVAPLPTAAYAGFGALIGVAGLRHLRRRAQNA